MLLDLELAEDGVPANVDLVPLAFGTAYRPFAHFTEVAERRRIADERVDFFSRGRGNFHSCEDQFEFLNKDTFDLEKLGLVFVIKFFGARLVQKLIKLFPTLQIVLQLLNEFVQFRVPHKRSVSVVAPH